MKQSYHAYRRRVKCIDRILNDIFWWWMDARNAIPWQQYEQRGDRLMKQARCNFDRSRQRKL